MAAEQSSDKNRIDDLVVHINKMLGEPDQVETFDSDEVMVITCLFDLTMRQSSHRTIDDYLKLGEHVLNLPVNMFIVTEPHLTLKIWQYRRMVGLADRTYIHTFRLEDSPYYIYYSDIVDFYNKNLKPQGYCKEISDRMNPNYLIVGWTRFYCIELAANYNPFDSKCSVWIDFGIYYIDENKEDMYNLMVSMLSTYRKDKLSACLLGNSYVDELDDMDNYYSKVNLRIAAGMFGGPTDLMRWLSNDFKFNLDECMRLGRPTVDEMIINVTCIKYPEIFDFHYSAQHHDVLLNKLPYNSDITHSITTHMLYNMPLFVQQNRDRAFDKNMYIGRYFLLMIQRHRMEVLVYIQLAVLDELLLAGMSKLYRDRGGVQLSNICAEQMSYLLTSTTHNMIANKDLLNHYLSNLACFDIKIIELNGKLVRQ